jgi:hypothetical protein
VIERGPEHIPAVRDGLSGMPVAAFCIDQALHVGGAKLFQSNRAERRRYMQFDELVEPFVRARLYMRPSAIFQRASKEFAHLLFLDRHGLTSAKLGFRRFQLFEHVRLSLAVYPTANALAGLAAVLDSGDEIVEVTPSSSPF